MTRLFAQVDVGFLHSDLLDALRSELGLSTDEAIGKMVRFWHAVLQARNGGDIGGRSDAWIEESVGWRGDTGAFAALIRRLHVEDDVVIGWKERYGKYDKKRDRDRRSQTAMRDRKRANRSTVRSVNADVSADVSADLSEDVSADELPIEETGSAFFPLTSSSSPRSYEDKNTIPEQEPVGREESSDPMVGVLADARLVPEEFGTDWQFVEGLIRAARNPSAVAATFRALLDGTNGPPSSPAEVGRAARDFAATGERFNPRYFCGFVREARKAAQAAENKRRAARESAYIDHEEVEREKARREEAQASALIADFERRDPETLATLRAKAEQAIDPRMPGHIRELMVRAQLLRLIREALQ